MKKRFSRIIMLIMLLSMLLELMMPALAFAGESVKCKPKEGTGWYRASTLQTKITYDNDKGEQHEVTPMFDGGPQPESPYPRFYLFGDTEYTIQGGNPWSENGGLTFIVEKYGSEKDSGALDKIEHLLADFVIGLANGLHLLTSWALGEEITIDSIVFNKYRETNISYFPSMITDDSQKSSLIYGVNGGRGMYHVVNAWYGLFFKIAVMFYMAVLVYMGLRILLSSTAGEKADYKRFIWDWLVGMAMLFLFPYVMRLIIELNNGLVKSFADEADAAAIQTTKGVVVVDYGQDFYRLDLNSSMDWSAGDDYMSVIGRLAMETNKLAIALAFLIMTWQLIALIVMYFKRLFMVGFLIAIFPLVVISYAIDKIADGKSQALNTWLKEYVLNVFVQSFHAALYMFIFLTIYSASSGRGSNDEYDFILIIIGVSFLFKGESIVREIFGQVSSADTMKKLGESALATYGAIHLATRAVRKTADLTIGENSVPRKLWHGGQVLRAQREKERAFDNAATFPEEYHPEERMEGMPDEPEGNKISLKSQSDYEKQRKYMHAAWVLNNPKSTSVAEQADALRMLTNLQKEDSDNEVFNHVQITKGQIQAMSQLEVDIQKMYQSGVDNITIERNITARLGYILQTSSPEIRKQLTDAYMAGLYMYGATSMVSRNDARDVVYDTVEKIHDIRDSFNYVYNFDDEDAVDPDQIETIKADIVSRYSRDDLSASELEELEDTAAEIAVINNREKGITHVRAQYQLEQLRKKANGNNELLKQVIDEQLDGDVDILSHIVAKEIKETPTSAMKVDSYSADYARELNHAKDWAEKVTKEYEDNPREGYHDDEVSEHEVIAAMTTKQYDAVKKHINFYTSDSKLTDEDKAKAGDRCYMMFETYKDRYSDYGDEDTINTLAQNLTVLKQMNDGIYTEKEVLDAAVSIREQAGTSKDLAEIIQSEMLTTPDVIVLSVAERIVESEEVVVDSMGNENPTGKMANSTLNHGDAVKAFQDAQKEVNNSSEITTYDGIDDVVQRLYEARTAEVAKHTSEVAEHYLNENNVDLLEGGQDLDTPSLDGEYKGELEIERIDKALGVLGSLSPFGNNDAESGGAGFGEAYFLKRALAQREREETGVRESWEEHRRNSSIWNTDSVQDRLNEYRKKRKNAQDSHYYGDIKDWKKK